jgi:hypothetical protein
MTQSFVKYIFIIRCAQRAAGNEGLSVRIYGTPDYLQILGR